MNRRGFLALLGLGVTPAAALVGSPEAELESAPKLRYVSVSSAVHHTSYLRYWESKATPSLVDLT